MIASSLASILAAIDASDIPDEDKAEASQSVSAAFANTDQDSIPDDEATEAMPEAMAAAMADPATSDDDKKKNLKATKHMLKAAEAKAIYRMTKGKGREILKAAPVQQAGTQQAPAGLTKQDLVAAIGTAVSTAIDKLKTENLATIGAPPAKPNGQQNGRRDEEKSSFIKTHVEPLVAGGVAYRDALSAARSKHPDEFKEWQKSVRKVA